MLQDWDLGVIHCRMNVLAKGILRSFKNWKISCSWITPRAAVWSAQPTITLEGVQREEHQTDIITPCWGFISMFHIFSSKRQLYLTLNFLTLGVFISGLVTMTTGHWLHIYTETIERSPIFCGNDSIRGFPLSAFIFPASPLWPMWTVQSAYCEQMLSCSY